jgi:hypothetical protein
MKLNDNSNLTRTAAHCLTSSDPMGVTREGEYTNDTLVYPLGTEADILPALQEQVMSRREKMKVDKDDT